MSAPGTGGGRSARRNDTPTETEPDRDRRPRVPLARSLRGAPGRRGGCRWRPSPAHGTGHSRPTTGSATFSGPPNRGDLGRIGAVVSRPYAARVHLPPAGRAEVRNASPYRCLGAPWPGLPPRRASRPGGRGTVREPGSRGHDCAVRGKTRAGCDPAAQGAFLVARACDGGIRRRALRRHRVPSSERTTPRGTRTPYRLGPVHGEPRAVGC